MHFNDAGTFGSLSEDPLPATDSSRTARTTLYTPVQVVSPYSPTPFFCKVNHKVPLVIIVVV